MPVTGTPLNYPNATAPDGSTFPLPDTKYAQPKVTVLDDTPLVPKKQTIIVKDARTKTVTWTMKTADGTPVDLTTYDESNNIITPACALRVAEWALPGTVYYDFTGTVTDPTSGQVEATVNTATLTGPGIFDAEFQILNPDSSIALSNLFFLAVERSLYGATLGGPPTFSEIRLFLRDNAPAENRLLDQVQFDDAEIAGALAMPVAYWNEALPPIAPFNTQTFPYRYNWIHAAIAQLLLLAAEWYRRNRLAYSAGGVTVDDMNLADTCEQAGLRRWQEYKDWVRQRKVALNADAAFGSLGSPYRFRGYGNSYTW